MAWLRLRTGSNLKCGFCETRKSCFFVVVGLGVWNLE
jgi:hypothetical protein